MLHRCRIVVSSLNRPVFDDNIIKSSMLPLCFQIGKSSLVILYPILVLLRMNCDFPGWSTRAICTNYRRKFSRKIQYQLTKICQKALNNAGNLSQRSLFFGEKLHRIPSIRDGAAVSKFKKKNKYRFNLMSLKGNKLTKFDQIINQHRKVC